MLQKIELEIICPGHAVKIAGFTLNNNGEKIDDFTFCLPKVRKLVLTKETELILWGKVTKWRDCRLPPLWNEKGREGIGFTTKDQAEIYNERQRVRFRHQATYINPGIVKVRESGWDIHMENMEPTMETCPECKGTGKYIGFSSVEPCRSCKGAIPNSNTRIETLPGASSLGEIDDTVYFRNKLYTALNFPKNYFSQEDPNASA